MSDREQGPAFWTKPLGEMTQAEWEALCDGCGRCCLVKLEDEDTQQIHYTDLSCRLLDPHACRCRDYKNRQQKVVDCIQLDLEKLNSLSWLPPSCAYRLLSQNKPLFWWHPLISGRAETVHEAGISVRGRIAGDEDEIPVAEWQDHLVRWPLRLPKRAR